MIRIYFSINGGLGSIDTKNAYIRTADGVEELVFKVDEKDVISAIRWVLDGIFRLYSSVDEEASIPISQIDTIINVCE